VHKKPPTSAGQLLSGLQVNRQMMTHCITGETDTSKVKQSGVAEQKCNYYCFVSRMDPKGSTPQEIQDVMYVLDMMQRYYTTQRPPPSAKGGEDLFDVPRVAANGAKIISKNGAVFHKYYEKDEAVTVPILKMKLFIEQANTGGESPLVMFFMFLVVEVPITFDFPDAVYRSCSKAALGKEKMICEDMKRIWVNIAHRHETFSGAGKNSLESMLQIQFNDIFDPDSVNCFSKIFRIPRCIQQARLFMHMWAVDNITKRSKISLVIANVLVNIRFSCIDKVFQGHCPALLSDGIFANMSNLCVSSFCNSFERYKHAVREFRVSKKRTARKAAGAVDAAEDDDDDGGSQMDATEMPVFEPDVIESTPTFIDWDCADTKDMVTKMVVEGTLDCPADCVRTLREHVQKYPNTVKMQGFPLTDMVAYVDASMFLPHSGSYVGIMEWLLENKECALPDQMTMCILVMMHQKNISSRAIFSSFMQSEEQLPRNILTLSDLRTSFLSDTGSGRTMMYRRATNIRDKQMISVTSRPIGTQRGYALMYYLLGTVYPLSYANARSDTGNYGGKDHAASVFNEIGEFQNTGSNFLSSIAEGFQKARAAIVACDKSGNDDSYPFLPVFCLNVLALRK